MNDETRSANENETHNLRQGLGEVGHPFHDVDHSQTVNSMGLSKGLDRLNPERNVVGSASRLHKPVRLAH